MENFWDREVVEQQHLPWMGIPEVRVYLNELIGRGERLWPIEWLKKWLGERTFDRALSIGCGSGAVERQLITLGIAHSVDAFDGSVVSLSIARRAADEEGIGDCIRYFAMNFNEPALPRGRYDLVVFHQSAHHVAKLEKLYRSVLRSMKPDGLLYLDEYVGPSRFDWRDEHLAAQRAVFATLPRALRQRDDLPFPIQEDDPSEAIRSSEIEPQLLIGFELVERRPYGGCLLSVILPQLRSEQLTHDDIVGLINAERTLIAGETPAYYSIFVARPKRGLAKAWARARYFVEPKVKAAIINTRVALTGQ